MSVTLSVENIEKQQLDSKTTITLDYAIHERFMNHTLIVAYDTVVSQLYVLVDDNVIKLDSEILYKGDLDRVVDEILRGYARSWLLY
jgi:hypothetical protein